MSRGDERSAGRQRGDTYYKERRGHGHGKDDEDNERWRVRNRWAKTYLFHVRIEYILPQVIMRRLIGARIFVTDVSGHREVSHFSHRQRDIVVYERRVCLAAHASQESVLSFVSLKIPLCLFIGPGSLCSLLRYNTASYINFYTALINAGARDRADHSRAMSETGRKKEGGGAYIRGCWDRGATRDRVTARYLWDTNREIIEARCTAISRHLESFNKSWKYGRSGQYRERDTSGSMRTGFVSFGD